MVFSEITCSLFESRLMYNWPSDKVCILLICWYLKHSNEKQSYSEMALLKIELVVITDTVVHGGMKCQTLNYPTAV